MGGSGALKTNLRRSEEKPNPLTTLLEQVRRGEVAISGVAAMILRPDDGRAEREGPSAADLFSRAVQHASAHPHSPSSAPQVDPDWQVARRGLG